MPNDKLAKHEAFTLVELIIVITIIGLLTSTLVLDFRGAQDQQELATMADQSLAMMQQSRAEVTAGKVSEEAAGGEDEDGDGVADSDVAILTPLCEGVYFEVGGTPQLATGFYDAASGGCTDLTAADYGLSSGDAQVSAIFADGAGYNEGWALYVPPEGAFYFAQDDAAGLESADLEVIFSHPVSEQFSATLSVSAVTGQPILTSGSDVAASDEIQ